MTNTPDPRIERMVEILWRAQQLTVGEVHTTAVNALALLDGVDLLRHPRQPKKTTPYKQASK